MCLCGTSESKPSYSWLGFVFIMDDKTTHLLLSYFPSNLDR